MNCCVNSGSSNPFLTERPLQLAAKSGHPLGQIGLEADAALLAVVGDDHAGPALLFHDIGDPLVDHVVELGLVDLLAGLVGDQKVVEFLAARQTAGMRGQNVIDAFFHRNLPSEFCSAEKADAAIMPVLVAARKNDVAAETTRQQMKRLCGLPRGEVRTVRTLWASPTVEGPGSHGPQRVQILCLRTACKFRGAWHRAAKQSYRYGAQASESFRSTNSVTALLSKWCLDQPVYKTDAPGEELYVVTTQSSDRRCGHGFRICDDLVRPSRRHRQSQTLS